MSAMAEDRSEQIRRQRLAAIIAAALLIPALAILAAGPHHSPQQDGAPMQVEPRVFLA